MHTTWHRTIGHNESFDFHLRCMRQIWEVRRSFGILTCMLEWDRKKYAYNYKQVDLSLQNRDRYMRHTLTDRRARTLKHAEHETTEREPKFGRARTGLGLRCPGWDPYSIYSALVQVQSTTTANVRLNNNKNNNFLVDSPLFFNAQCIFFNGL